MSRRSWLFGLLNTNRYHNNSSTNGSGRGDRDDRTAKLSIVLWLWWEVLVAAAMARCYFYHASWQLMPGQVQMFKLHCLFLASHSSFVRRQSRPARETETILTWQTQSRRTPSLSLNIYLATLGANYDIKLNAHEARCSGFIVWRC